MTGRRGINISNIIIGGAAEKQVELRDWVQVVVVGIVGAIVRPVAHTVPRWCLRLLDVTI